MSEVYDVNEKLHKVRVKLYPNHLSKGEAYIARTSNEASVDTQDICAAMKNRGGFEGDYDEALNTVRHFFKEALYQLADGFTVDLGFCTLSVTVAGSFKSEKEAREVKSSAINFRFRSRKPLRDLADQIGIIVEGYADVDGHIEEFVDVGTHAENETITGGEQFVITGHKIKVAGDNAACGVYFESVQDNQRIKVKAAFAENNPAKIIGVAPILIAPRDYWVVVVTQFTTSGLLKEPREIKSGFTVHAE